MSTLYLAIKTSKKLWRTVKKEGHYYCSKIVLYKKYIVPPPRNAITQN